MIAISPFSDPTTHYSLGWSGESYKLLRGIQRHGCNRTVEQMKRVQQLHLGS